MKKMLILLSICTCVFACSKNDNETSPGNGSYQPSDVVTVDAPVMYTGNGIVTDQALIKDYVTRRGRLASFTFDATTASGANFSSFSLTFEDDKNVIRGNKKAEIISKNDTLMMLADVDFTEDSPDPEKTVSDSLLDLVQLGGPVTECPTYYTAPCKYKKKYPVLIIGGQYYLPYVVATVTSTTWVPTPFGVPMEWTETSHEAGQIMLFNRDVISQLSRFNATDTLVVQIARRVLTKQ